MIWLVVLAGSIGLGWLLGTGNASSNARTGMTAAPELLLTALLGITTGFCARDRVRLRRTYASPTLAYLGKGLLFAALSAGAAGILSPVDWPVLTLRICAAAFAAGVCLWLGNLPSRL